MSWGFLQRANIDLLGIWRYPIIWSILIAVVSLIPGPVLDTYPVISLISNLLHVFEFAVLSFLIMYAAGCGKIPKETAVYAAAFSLAYGALLEYLQLFVPGRFPSVYDVAADGLGAVIGILFFGLIYARSHRSG